MFGVAVGGGGVDDGGSGGGIFLDLFSFVFVLDHIQGLTHSKQARYQCAMSPALFESWRIWIWGDLLPSFHLLQLNITGLITY